MRVRHREVAREDVRDPVEGHDRAVRSRLDHGRPHRGIERQPVLAVLCVTDASQLVQEPEALVDEGVRREHVLLDQIGALARHASDEGLCGRIGIDMLLVVPGGHEGALMAGKTARPREPRLAVCVHGRGRGVQRPDVIRNSRGEYLQDVWDCVPEPRIEPALGVDDATHDLRMELVRDGAVISGVDAAQEPVLAERRDHIGVGRVRYCIRTLEEPLHPLLELLVGNHVEVVGRIAHVPLRAVELLHEHLVVPPAAGPFRAAEEVPVEGKAFLVGAVSGIRADDIFQREVLQGTQLAPVHLVLGHLVVRECLSGCKREKAL